MHLRHYLDRHGIKPRDFASDICVSTAALHRYLKDERTPKRAVMARIVEKTNGAVQPNDFFPAPIAGLDAAVAA